MKMKINLFQNHFDIKFKKRKKKEKLQSSKRLMYTFGRKILNPLC